MITFVAFLKLNFYPFYNFSFFFTFSTTSISSPSKDLSLSHSSTSTLLLNHIHLLTRFSFLQRIIYRKCESVTSSTITIYNDVCTQHYLYQIKNYRDSRFKLTHGHTLRKHLAFQLYSEDTTLHQYINYKS